MQTPFLSNSNLDSELSKSTVPRWLDFFIRRLDRFIPSLMESNMILYLLIIDLDAVLFIILFISEYTPRTLEFIIDFLNS